MGPFEFTFTLRRWGSFCEELAPWVAVSANPLLWSPPNMYLTIGQLPPVCPPGMMLRSDAVEEDFGGLRFSLIARGDGVVGVGSQALPLPCLNPFRRGDLRGTPMGYAPRNIESFYLEMWRESSLPSNAAAVSLHVCQYQVCRR